MVSTKKIRSKGGGGIKKRKGAKLVSFLLIVCMLSANGSTLLSVHADEINQGVIPKVEALSQNATPKVEDLTSRANGWDETTHGNGIYVWERWNTKHYTLRSWKNTNEMPWTGDAGGICYYSYSIDSRGNVYYSDPVPTFPPQDNRSVFFPQEGKSMEGYAQIREFFGIHNVKYENNGTYHFDTTSDILSDIVTEPSKGDTRSNDASSTSSTAYPKDGKHSDGYWYVAKGETFDTTAPQVLDISKSKDAEDPTYTGESVDVTTSASDALSGILGYTFSVADSTVVFDAEGVERNISDILSREDIQRTQVKSARAVKPTTKDKAKNSNPPDIICGKPIHQVFDSSPDSRGTANTPLSIWERWSINTTPTTYRCTRGHSATSGGYCNVKYQGTLSWRLGQCYWCNATLNWHDCSGNREGDLGAGCPNARTKGGKCDCYSYYCPAYNCGYGADTQPCRCVTSSNNCNAIVQTFPGSSYKGSVQYGDTTGTSGQYPNNGAQNPYWYMYKGVQEDHKAPDLYLSKGKDAEDSTYSGDSVPVTGNATDQSAQGIYNYASGIHSFEFQSAPKSKGVQVKSARAVSNGDNKTGDWDELQHRRWITHSPCGGTGKIPQACAKLQYKPPTVGEGMQFRWQKPVNDWVFTRATYDSSTGSLICSAPKQMNQVTYGDSVYMPNGSSFPSYPQNYYYGLNSGDSWMLYINSVNVIETDMDSYGYRLIAGWSVSYYLNAGFPCPSCGGTGTRQVPDPACGGLGGSYDYDLVDPVLSKVTGTKDAQDSSYAGEPVTLTSTATDDHSGVGGYDFGLPEKSTKRVLVKSASATKTSKPPTLSAPLPVEDEEPKAPVEGKSAKGAPVWQSSPVFTVPAGAGDVIVTCRVKDYAGNISTPVTIRVITKKTQSSLSGASDKNMTYGSGGTISISGGELSITGDIEYEIISGDASIQSSSYPDGDYNNATKPAKTTGVVKSSSGVTVVPRATGTTTLQVTKKGNNLWLDKVETIIITTLPKRLTVNGTVVFNSKTYDGTTTITTSSDTFALQGVPFTSDAISLSTTLGTLVSNEASSAQGVNLRKYTLEGANKSWYSLADADQPPLTGYTVEVKPKNLTVANTAVNNKVYDNNTSATYTGTPALVGVEQDVAISGQPPLPDDVSLLGGTPSFVTPTVGTSKALTFAPFSLGGTRASNYAIVQPTAGVASITTLELTIAEVGVKDKVYDSNTSTEWKTAPRLVGILGVNDVSLTNGVATFSDKNVGTDKVISYTNFVLGGSDAINYALKQPAKTTASISKLGITVTPVVVESKGYDGTTRTKATSSLVGVLAGDTVVLDMIIANFDTPKMGTHKPVTLDPLTISAIDSQNYSLTQPALTGYFADITLRKVGVIVTTNDKEWDGTTLATLKGAELSNILPTDTVTVTINGLQFVDADYGMAKPTQINSAVLGGIDVSNYELGEVTLVPAKIYDTKLPEASAVVNLNEYTVDEYTVTISAEDEATTITNIKRKDGVDVGVNDKGEYVYTSKANGVLVFEVTDLAGNKRELSVFSPFYTLAFADAPEIKAKVEGSNDTWKFDDWYKSSADVTLSGGSSPIGVVGYEYAISPKGYGVDEDFYRVPLGYEFVVPEMSYVTSKALTANVFTDPALCNPVDLEGNIGGAYPSKAMAGTRVYLYDNRATDLTHTRMKPDGTTMAQPYAGSAFATGYTVVDANGDEITLKTEDFVKDTGGTVRVSSFIMPTSGARFVSGNSKPSNALGGIQPDAIFSQGKTSIFDNTGVNSLADTKWFKIDKLFPEIDFEYKGEKLNK